MRKKSRKIAGATIGAALAGLGYLAWRHREKIGDGAEVFGEKIDQTTDQIKRRIKKD